MDAIDEKNIRFGELRRAFGSRETQAKFAERIGLDRTLVSKIETGSLSLTQKTIRILCEKIHANEEWLRTGKGEMFIEIKDSAFTETPEELDLLLTFRKLTAEMQKTFLALGKTLLEQQNPLSSHAIETSLHSEKDIRDTSPPEKGERVAG